MSDLPHNLTLPWMTSLQSKQYRQKKTYIKKPCKKFSRKWIEKDKNSPDKCTKKCYLKTLYLLGYKFYHFSMVKVSLRVYKTSESQVTSLIRINDRVGHGLVKLVLVTISSDLLRHGFFSEDFAKI